MKYTFYNDQPNIIAGITMKHPDVLEQNNTALHVAKNAEHVIKNRENLAQQLHISLDRFVTSEQTHSANFYKVTAADKGRGARSMETAIPNTDALYTYEAHIVLCTFTADCVPVTFQDKEKGIIGVIHTGWPGTVKEITMKLFQHLIEKEQSQPENIHVHLGPALSQKKFEVDEDVFTRYKQLGYADSFIYFNKDTNKYHIDNQKTVKKQCKLIGIPADQITVDTTCTFSSDQHFSYRQDKQTGRHLSFIMKTK